MKGTLFSTKTRTAITAVLVTAALLGFLAISHQKNRFVTAGASSADSDLAEIQRLGVPYRQATQHLTDCIPMEQAPAVHGQARYCGTSTDHTICLEVIGDSQAITEATMTIVACAAPKIETRNRALLDRFLSNIIPEWPTRSQWCATSLEKIAGSQETAQTVTWGYKKVTMAIMKASGTVTIQVKHA